MRFEETKCSPSTTDHPQNKKKVSALKSEIVIKTAQRAGPLGGFRIFEKYLFYPTIFLKNDITAHLKKIKFSKFPIEGVFEFLFPDPQLHQSFKPITLFFGNYDVTLKVYIEHKF